MNRPTEGAKDNITSEGGKPLLKAKKQDFLFGAGINAEAQNQQPTASSGRINKVATVNSANKTKEKSSHGVTLNTKCIARTPSGSSNTNRSKLPGDRDPNKGRNSSGKYKGRSPEDNDKKSSKAAGRASSLTRGIQSLSAYSNPKDRKFSEAPKQASSTRGTDSSSTQGTHTRNHNNDKKSTKSGRMTPKSTMSTEPDVPIVNGKTTTVHTEVSIYT